MCMKDSFSVPIFDIHIVDLWIKYSISIVQTFNKVWERGQMHCNETDYLADLYSI